MTIANARCNFQRGIAVKWIKKCRPDIWEKIRVVSFNKFPSKERKKAEELILPVELEQLK